MRTLLQVVLAACLIPLQVHAADAAAPDRRFRTDVLSVKFHDDTPVRAVAGQLEGVEPAHLAAAPAVIADLVKNGRWEPHFAATDEQLAEWRAVASGGRATPAPDLGSWLRVWVPDGMDGRHAIDELTRSGLVELALPTPNPAPPPGCLPGDLTAQQGYRGPAPVGLNIDAVRGFPGATGAGVRYADLEYAWSFNHADHPIINLIPPEANDPFDSTSHGTSVMGVAIAQDNNFGTTGIAPECTPYVVPTVTGGGSGVWDVGAALVRSLAVLDAGDVVLIEQQFFGPDNETLIPVEWWRPWYDVIVTAVGNGIIVVETAGNGGADLDAPIYGQDNGGHWPFQPDNDSGAIIVGAARAMGTRSRSRLTFSCYGSRLDVQAWGEAVATTGPGLLWSGCDADTAWTGAFNGTSSAGAIVGPVCVLVQSICTQATGTRVTPARMRDALITAGSTQTARPGDDGNLEHIGPRPDVTATLVNILGDHDCNANGTPDVLEILAGELEDADADLVPDTCQCIADRNDDLAVDVSDLLLYLEAWFNDAADLNDDGRSDAIDLLVYLENWFETSARGTC